MKEEGRARFLRALVRSQGMNTDSHVCFLLCPFGLHPLTLSLWMCNAPEMLKSLPQVSGLQWADRVEGLSSLLSILGQPGQDLADSEALTRQACFEALPCSVEGHRDFRVVKGVSD